MRVLIVRSAANKVNPNNYNLQEIGLGKALVRKEIECDIIYSNGRCDDNEQVIYNSNNVELRIKWLKLDYKILNNGIYKRLMNESFYSRYDLVILTEYTQIMTYFISKVIPNKVVLYQGPYKDSNKIVQSVYDKLFLKEIRKNIKRIYTKSKLAEEYMISKGFRNITTIGVGCDLENLEVNLKYDFLKEDELINDLYLKISGRKTLLYIGVLEERRNIYFLLDLVKKITEYDRNVVLILIGNGKEKEKYLSYIKEINIEENVIYIEKISQSQLKGIHELSDIFLLPTKYEIFGMVLLESMYLGTPIITSKNGGSSMLIDNGNTGYILENFDLDEWSRCILKLLSDKELRSKIIKNSKLKVEKEFTWDTIAENILVNSK